MAKHPDYAKLSDDELWAENKRLMAERTAIGDQQDAIRAVLNGRIAGAKATEILEGLTPGQRDVLIEAAAAMAGAGATAPGQEG